MAAARRVGVRELVDEHDGGRRASIASRSISLSVWPRYSIAWRGMTSSPSSSVSVSARPWVSTTPTTTSTPSRCALARRLEHGVGLADAGRRADEDPEAAALRARGGLEQRVGRRAALALGLAVRHAPECLTVRRCVQGEVEQQHVHARLAEEAELAALGVLGDQLRDRAGREAARARHAAAW